MTPSWPIDPLIVAGMLTILLALAWRGARAESDRWRWARLGLRVAMIVGLGAVLIGVGRWVDAERAELPEVTLVLDTSRSMGATDAAGRSRLDAFRQTWLNSESLASLRASARVSILTIDESLHAITAGEIEGLAATGARSRLVRGLGEQRPSGPAHRLVLLSDGVDTDGLALTDLLNTGEPPAARFEVVSLPTHDAPRDARIESEFERSWTRSDEAAELIVSIAGNMRAGAAARLVIREDAIDGPVIAERLVPVDGVRRERFEIVPRFPVAPGGIALARYYACLEEIERDAEPMNNRSVALIQVAGDGRRVLVIEGEPDWESRFLVDALVSEAGAEVTTLYAMGGRAPPRITRITTEPGSIVRRVITDQRVDAEWLAEFDLLVLGRGVTELIEAEVVAGIREQVEERGVGLLLLRGPDVPVGLEWASEFEVAGEPVEFDRASLEWRGGDSDSLEAVRLRLHRGALRGDAVAAAHVEGVPVIVESSRGLGRVATMLAEGLWQTALASDAGRDASRRFWNRLARRLTDHAEAPDPAAGSVWLDRVVLDAGERVRAVAYLRDAPPTPASLRVIDPAGHEQRLSLSHGAGSSNGVLETTFSPTAPGEHRVVVEADGSGEGAPITSAFIVRPGFVETVGGAVRDAELRRLAEMSGGSVWPIDGCDAFIRSLRREHAAGETEPRFVPLWNEYWFFAVIAGLACAEWWLRRRGGLA